jgi:enterobactin synthetase component D
VARREDAASVGIDTEECLEAARAERVGPGILDEEERRLARLSPAGLAIWTTAAFSVKESLFKLLHPVVGRSFFYAAASLVTIDLDAGRFLVRLNVDLAAGYPAGLRFEGRTARLEGRVHTALWLDPGGRPGDAGW